jgi:hypothetical protein
MSGAEFWQQQAQDEEQQYIEQQERNINQSERANEHIDGSLRREWHGQICLDAQPRPGKYIADPSGQEAASIPF